MSDRKNIPGNKLSRKRDQDFHRCCYLVGDKQNLQNQYTFQANGYCFKLVHRFEKLLPSCLISVLKNDIHDGTFSRKKESTIEQ